MSNEENDDNDNCENTVQNKIEKEYNGGKHTMRSFILFEIFGI